MTKKNMPVILLCAMLIASLLLAACSGGNNASSQPPATQGTTGAAQDATKPAQTDSASTEPPAQTAAAAGAATAGEGLPLTDKKTTFSMAASKRDFSPEYDGMPLLTDLESRTNVHVEWNLIPQSQYAEKKNIILASNELPDAFFGQTALTMNDLVMYGSTGSFIDLKDLVKKHAPNITKLMGENDLFGKVAFAPDGNMYGLPRAKQLGYNDAPDQLFIYKPWLEKLGLGIPATLDEFHNVLSEFKNKDPNGNGLQDEIPFTFRYKTHYQGMYSLFGSFGLPDNYLNDILSHVAIKGGKMLYVPVQPEYKEAIAYFHTYFAEGLIDKEAFTMDSNAYVARGATDDVIVGAHVTWNDFDVAGAVRKDDYTAVPPMKGPRGEQSWNSYMHDNNGIVGNGFSITNVCKDPELLIRWADLFYDKEFSIEVQAGPIGYNIKKAAGGKFEYLPIPDGMTADEFNFHYSPVDAPSAVFYDVYKSGLLPMSDTMATKNRYVELYRPYMTVSTYPGGVTFTPEENTRLAALATDIGNFVNDRQAQWLLNGGIDAEWDSYLASLKTMGLDEMLNLYETALNRFNN